MLSQQSRQWSPIVALMLVFTLFCSGASGCSRRSRSGDASAPTVSRRTPTTIRENTTRGNNGDRDGAAVPAAVETAVLEAAGNLTSAPPTRLTLTAARPQDWSDSCLGLGTAAELCAAVIVPGWSVTASDGRQEWVFRTDEEGRRVRLEPGS